MGWVHQNKLRLWARISLVVLLLSIVKQFIGILQIQYQLTSPFIPESGILSIVRLFLIVGLITTLVSIAGLLFYFLEKYKWVIILAALALIGTYFYPYFL
jgi:hypothetical protein